MHYRLFL